jgi:hypothetical protein
VPGSLQSYINLGSDGCTIGETKFFDFLDLGPIPGATGLAADAVTVNPFGGLYTPGLEFRVNAGAAAGELLELRLGYTLESLQAPIVLAQLGMTG